MLKIAAASTRRDIGGDGNEIDRLANTGAHDTGGLHGLIDAEFRDEKLAAI
jgi:hypothetical protein